MPLISFRKVHLVLLRDGLGELEPAGRVEGEWSEDDVIVLSDEDELGSSRGMVQRRTETKIGRCRGSN